MTKGEILLRRELKREMGSTEPLLEEEIERLNKKLRVEKIKFYRNRRLFESFIDVVLPIIDEDLLKKITNLTYKTLKEEILKKYDEDIKQN